MLIRPKGCLGVVTLSLKQMFGQCCSCCNIGPAHYRRVGAKLFSTWEQFTRSIHCVVTEKVPAMYRSFKMADASLDKCSIFVDWCGNAWTRLRLSVHRGKTCVETFQNTGTVAETLGKAVWGVKRSGVKRTVPWIACWWVENGTCMLRRRYLQIKNGTCRMRTVLAMCNRLGNSIFTHSISCIDPWYGSRTIRTIEFLGHMVAFKSTEPFAYYYMLYAFILKYCFRFSIPKRRLLL